MSHFAQIENGIVTNVIVAEQDFIDSGLIGDPNSWIQTSFNSRGGVHYLPNSNEPSGQPHLRYNYAGIGYTYDSVKDAFIPPKPYNSWVLNEATCLWEPPIPYPNDGNPYVWDEEKVEWKFIQLAVQL